MNYQQALIAIDGTDSLTIRTKELGSIPTHVESFRRRFQGSTTYFDGPGTFGTASGQIAAEASDQALAWLYSDAPYELSLVGWSRGAMIAVEVCRTIAKYRPDVKIRFLGLFDPVDMSFSITDGAVTNVTYGAIARRDPAFGSWNWWTQVSTRDVKKKVRIHSRDIPEDRILTTPAKLQLLCAHQHEKTFYTSHGGIGGALLAMGTTRNYVKNALLAINPVKDNSPRLNDQKMQRALIEQHRALIWMIRHATNAGLNL